MNTLTGLNSYSGTPISFTATTITTTRVVGQAFNSPTMTWIPVQQLGPLSAYGAQISYDVSGVAGSTVAFNSAGSAQNPLTITNPGPGVYVVKGILSVVDYIAAVATITPPGVYSGNVVYTATYTNTNSAAGNFVLHIVGVA